MFLQDGNGLLQSVKSTDMDDSDLTCLTIQCHYNILLVLIRLLFHMNQSLFHTILLFQMISLLLKCQMVIMIMIVLLLALALIIIWGWPAECSTRYPPRTPQKRVHQNVNEGEEDGSWNEDSPAKRMHRLVSTLYIMYSKNIVILYVNIIYMWPEIFEELAILRLSKFSDN